MPASAGMSWWAWRKGAMEQTSMVKPLSNLDQRCLQISFLVLFSYKPKILLHAHESESRWLTAKKQVSFDAWHNSLWHVLEDVLLQENTLWCALSISLFLVESMEETGFFLVAAAAADNIFLTLVTFKYSKNGWQSMADNPAIVQLEKGRCARHRHFSPSSSASPALRAREEQQASFLTV